MEQKVILVSGASSGIGLATAMRLAGQGHVVYGAARRPERIPSPVRAMSLDVADDDQCVACVSRIIDEQGRLDVLFGNAGYGLYGALEEVPIEEARRELDVNLFGVARLIRLVLPHMRAAGQGKVIITSSIAGKVSAPLGTWYHTSKFALEGLADCLRLEVERLGIHVVLIEPGLIKTPFYRIAIEAMSRTSGKGPYADLAVGMSDTFRQVMNGEGMYGGSDPDVIASLVQKAVDADRPRTRYSAGKMSWTSRFSRAVLPDRIYDKAISVMMAGRT